MEVPVLNPVEITVENQDMELLQDIEAQYYTHYIVKPLVNENYYSVNAIKYTPT